MACIYRGDWAGVGELMLHSAHKLKAVGTDFLVCPDNTIHQALPHCQSAPKHDPGSAPNHGPHHG